jgi:hypothetical protein
MLDVEQKHTAGLQGSIDASVVLCAHLLGNEKAAGLKIDD